MISYFESLLDVVTDSLESIDEEVFDRLINEVIITLDSGHRIIASGIGKNVPICEKFVGTMISMNMEAVFLNVDSAIHGDLGYLRDGDLLIILSKSGETYESITLIQEIIKQKRQIKMWLITYNPNSSLSRLIPNCLSMILSSEGDRWEIIPNNSSTINLIVLQSIAVFVAERKGLSLEVFKRNHPGGAIGKQLSSSDC